MPELALPGVTLAYDQSGRGPDVVWLAAGDNPGSNWRRDQTPAFEPGYRNTTYDARGAGATGSETGPPWDIPVHAEDAAALIEAVCDGPAFLVGLSMGSLTAVQLAHDRPDLVRAAVVMGTCVRKTGFIREWGAAPGLRPGPLRDAVLPRRGARRRRDLGADQAVRGGRLRRARRRDA